jgi:hypothetical protein
LLTRLPCSDYRIEQFGYCSFGCAEAQQFHPDHQPHGSASLATGRIPSDFWGNSNECSVVYHGWENRSPEGVVPLQPFLTLDQGASAALGPEYADFDEYFDFSSYSKPTQEPRSYPSLGVSQFAHDVVADTSQSYSYFHPAIVGVQQQPLIPRSSALNPHAGYVIDLENFSSASSPSLEPSPPRFPAPQASDRCLEDTRGGRVQIERKPRKDTRRTAEPLRLSCGACLRTFPTSKDLKRHQMRCSLALQLNGQQLKQVLCTCGKLLSRKDVLQRHMTNANSKENSEHHKCAVCQRCDCRCRPLKTTSILYTISKNPDYESKRSRVVGSGYLVEYQYLGYFCRADGRDHVSMIIASQNPPFMEVRVYTLGR